MKLGFSANAYKRFDLLTTMDTLQEIGFDGIEILCDIPHAYPPDLTPARRQEIKARAENNGLKICNLNAFMLYALGDCWRPSYIEKEASERRKRINHTLSCIDLAAEWGVPHLSIEPGGPLDGAKEDWALDVFEEAIHELAEHAEKKGVTVMIEPEPELLIETSGQFLKFMERISSSRIGLNFDIGHFYCAGEDPVQLVSQLAAYTKHYHLEDISNSRIHHHLVPGEGAIDFRAVLNEIAKTNYDGFITIELYPYEEDPVPATKKAFEYISPILQELARTKTAINGSR